MELGVPLDGSRSTDALERNPDKLSEIYKWSLVRMYDAYGAANPTSGNPQPVNVVVYRYVQDGGQSYLSDIFDTTPVNDATTNDTTKFLHHTALEYEERTDPTVSYRSGWRIEQRRRLKRVDVTSGTFNDGVAQRRRQLVRYHFGYEAAQHASLLTSVQVEGRCSGQETDAPREEPNGLLPKGTDCPRLSAMTFGYSHVAFFTSNGKAASAPFAGYEGFDARIRTLASSPRHEISEELTDLIDLDSDGLPDVLSTDTGLYGEGHGVFRNSVGGRTDSFGAVEEVQIAGVLGANANSITLRNSNLNLLDVNGDATVDLLHMPAFRTYSVYEITRGAKGWLWQGCVINTAKEQNPKVDFGRDAQHIRTLDVNFDGLIDAVVSTGTQLQTFFSLGRYPHGDGQFGQATRTSAVTADISVDPVTSCLPDSGEPVSFDDPEIKIADMNGDSIPDIVRLQRGNIHYWPGRGNGFWGTGKRDDCANGFASNRHITMGESPYYSDLEGKSLFLDDVNGDGLADLLQVHDKIDVWLNVDGSGWTQGHILAGSTADPWKADRVRLVDINGSGTGDILEGTSSSYRYIDLQGGTRPWLLTSIANGLGKTTDLEYLSLIHI